jgi:hypothetical protein
MAARKTYKVFQLEVRFNGQWKLTYRCSQGLFYKTWDEAEAARQNNNAPLEDLRIVRVDLED